MPSAIAPTVNYSFYPAFVEYPGSTSLSLPVARELLLDVIHGIAKFGPRRFYLINMGLSTSKPLAEAAALLAIEGIALRYFDGTTPVANALDKQVQTQQEGTHADELETSVMLAIDASLVNMKKAVVEYMPGAPARGPFSPDPKSARYSASGVYGDATRATAGKGHNRRSDADHARRDRRPPSNNPTHAGRAVRCTRAARFAAQRFEVTALAEMTIGM